jgi:hypothetical protein
MAHVEPLTTSLAQQATEKAAAGGRKRCRGSKLPDDGGGTSVDSQLMRSTNKPWTLAAKSAGKDV